MPTHLIKNSRGNIAGQMTECDTCNNVEGAFRNSHPINSREYAVVAEGATGRWAEVLWPVSYTHLTLPTNREV